MTNLTKVEKKLKNMAFPKNDWIKIDDDYVQRIYVNEGKKIIVRKALTGRNPEVIINNGHNFEQERYSFYSLKQATKFANDWMKTH